MFKKSFSEILKENLNEDSFKTPIPIPIPLPLPQTLFSLDPFLLDLKRHYLTVKDVEKIYGSRSFHKKMFKEPVKMAFYWCEEDWQGSLFVVYTYKNKYIYIHGGFGSCEVCDGFPQSEENLIKTFQSLNVTDSIEDILLPIYTHPDLLKHFDKFKLKISKQQTKAQQSILEIQTPEIQTPEIQTKKMWASLFK